MFNLVLKIVLIESWILLKKKKKFFCVHIYENNFILYLPITLSNILLIIF